MMRTDRTSAAAAVADSGMDRDATNARLGRNVVSSVAAKVLYLATRFSLPPIILAHITLEEYGIWALAFILVAYLGMGAFGVSNVYVRYVAEYQASGQTHRIGDLLSTGLVLVSTFATLTLIALWFILPTLLTWFSVPADLEATAFVLLFGTVAVFMLDLSLGAFVYVLAGLQKIVLQNRIWIASFLLETLLVVTFLLMGLGVLGLLYAFALRYVLSISLSVWMCWRNLPGLRLSPRRFNREHLRICLRFGGVLQLSGLLGMFLRSVEKLVAGLFINVQAVGLFDVAQKFPVMATSIPSSINAAYLPAVTQLHAQGRAQEFCDFYLGGARQINLLTGFMMGFMAAFSAPLFTAWLGPQPGFELAPLILACFTLPFQLNVVTGAATNVYRGMAQPLRELLYPVSQLLLVVVLVGSGFGLFGVEIGVIVAGVAAAMIASALLYFAASNRFLGIRQRLFLRRVLLPGLLPYLSGFGLMLLMNPWIASAADDRLGSLAVVLAGGLAYVTLQSALLWFLQLTASEKSFLRSRLAPLAGPIAVLRWRSPRSC
ncbi:MAG: oligosaccharide flippase family protein [Gammaproteobacteria bacterium]|nr:oligosaccharide flippase family protein [Gammaproteobacteria bacterium]